MNNNPVDSLSYGEEFPESVKDVLSNLNDGDNYFFSKQIHSNINNAYEQPIYQGIEDDNNYNHQQYFKSSLQTTSLSNTGSYNENVNKVNHLWTDDTDTTTTKSNIKKNDNHLNNDNIRRQNKISKRLETVSIIRGQFYQLSLLANNNSEHYWCILCNTNGHLLEKGCPQTFCTKCQRNGHLSSSCTNDVNINKDSFHLSNSSKSSSSSSLPELTQDENLNKKSIKIDNVNNTKNTVNIIKGNNDKKGNPNKNKNKAKRCFVCKDEGHVASLCKSEVARRCMNINCQKLIHFSQVMGNKCKFCYHKVGINPTLKRTLLIQKHQKLAEEGLKNNLDELTKGVNKSMICSVCQGNHNVKVCPIRKVI